LLLAELGVTRQLGHPEVVRRQPLAEAAHHLLHQRLEWRDVDDLEGLGVYLAWQRGIKTTLLI